MLCITKTEKAESEAQQACTNRPDEQAQADFPPFLLGKALLVGAPVCVLYIFPLWDIYTYPAGAGRGRGDAGGGRGRGGGRQRGLQGEAALKLRANLGTWACRQAARITHRRRMRVAERADEDGIESQRLLSSPSCFEFERWNVKMRKLERAESTTALA